MIKVLHISDIHLGSGLVHGKINPETGLNTRLEDFIHSLQRAIDRAIADPVDLVLFAGDAFPDATPPPYVQEAFAREFRRLADAQIPTILLVGNHDQHAQGNGGASLSIYRTLAVPGFIVGDNLTTHTMATVHGPIQVITLPWINRSQLLTRKDIEKHSLEEIHELLIEQLKPVLEAEIRRLDPAIPTILLGHLMADRANLGAERLLAVGKSFTIPLALLIREELDYVALGHVHRHQNLNPKGSPPVIYPGSIERVDFSEEKEEKGYVIAQVEKGHCDWEFVPLPVRRFLTITVDATQAEDPEAHILRAIAKEDIHEVVVRLIYQINSEQLDRINTPQLQKALASAHSFTIKAELISQLSRPRLPELGLGQDLDPLNALQSYIDNREGLKDLAAEMIDAAERLLGEEIEFDWNPQ